MVFRLVCLWYVYGVLWFVYGLSMVCLWCQFALIRARRNWAPTVDAKHVPSRAKNVRCPKDIYLMAEEVLGHGKRVNQDEG